MKKQIDKVLSLPGMALTAQAWQIDCHMVARRKAVQEGNTYNIVVLLEDNINKVKIPMQSKGKVAKYIQANFPIGMFDEPIPVKVWFQLQSKILGKTITIDKPLISDIEKLPV